MQYGVSFVLICPGTYIRSEVVTKTEGSVS